MAYLKKQDEMREIRRLILFTTRKLSQKLIAVKNEQTQQSINRFREIATNVEESYIFQGRPICGIGVNKLINLIIKLLTALRDTEYSPNNICIGKRAEGYIAELHITLLECLGEKIRHFMTTNFFCENHDHFCESKKFFMLFGNLFEWGAEMRECLQEGKS